MRLRRVPGVLAAAAAGGVLLVGGCAPGDSGGSGAYDVDTTKPAHAHPANPEPSDPRVEAARAQSRRNAQAAAAREGNCGLPAAGPDDQVVMLGVYEGEALSSAAAGGVNEETQTIEVNIEPGTRRLFLVLNSYSSIIWRFTGAASRISHVVASTYVRDPDGAPAVGATGIASADFTAVGRDCLADFNAVATPEADAAARDLTTALGRGPDVVAGQNSLARIRLPSGMGAKGDRRMPPPAGFEAEMWGDTIHFNPAGLVRVDPAAVVGAKAVAYDILPNQAGLAQLLGSGAVIRQRGRLKIVRPIAHYPAELTGSHLVSFILAKDVPVPGGDPGHSCVIAEDSGQPIGRPSLCQIGP